MIETVAKPFEKVLEEHRELDLLAKGLERFLDRPRPPVGGGAAEDLAPYQTWAMELSHLLLELHDKLLLHFREEERSGLFEEMTRLSPRFHSKIERLEAEHGAMLGELKGLLASSMNYAESRRDEGEGLRARTRALLDLLHRHEQAETELIVGVYYQDLGQGD